MFFHSIHWSSPPSIFQLAEGTAPCFSQHEHLIEEELKNGIEKLQQYVKKISYLSMSLMTASIVLTLAWVNTLSIISSFILVFFTSALDRYGEYINNNLLNKAEDAFEKIKEKISLENEPDISTDWSSLPSIYQWLFGNIENIFPKRQLINKFELENGIEKLKKNIGILNTITGSIEVFTFGLSFYVSLKPCIALTLFCLTIRCYIKSVESNVLVKAENKQKRMSNVDDFDLSNLSRHESEMDNIFLEVENGQKENSSNVHDFEFLPTEYSCADQNLIVTA